MSLSISSSESQSPKPLFRKLGVREPLKKKIRIGIKSFRKRRKPHQMSKIQQLRAKMFQNKRPSCPPRADPETFLKKKKRSQNAKISQKNVPKIPRLLISPKS